MLRFLRRRRSYRAGYNAMQRRLETGEPIDCYERRDHFRNGKSAVAFLDGICDAEKDFLKTKEKK